MLEVAPERHGVENNKNIYEYLKDDYYNFWVKHAQKFGFMVDKNAPWRLVFNVASGFKQYQADPDDLVGAHLFMNRYGVSYDNVFQYRFLKAYKHDLLNLKNVMQVLYEGFYQQFSTYEKEEFQLDKSGRCRRVKVIHKREYREPPPPIVSDSPEENEYWLKALLKLRMIETRYPHDAYSFNGHADTVIERHRIFGLETALRYINGLTKGFNVTKFNMEGGYWHGVPTSEYKERRRKALENVQNPTNVQYSVTGTKNTRK